METNELLGLNADQLSTVHMIVRGLIVFFTILLLIRVTGIRMLGKHTAFDTLTVILLGTILGRLVVVPDQPFLGSIVAALVISALHRTISWLTYWNKTSGKLFKGTHLVLYKDGVRQEAHMKKTNITDADIHEALRQSTHRGSLDGISEIYLERSGQISFVLKDPD